MIPPEEVGEGNRVISIELDGETEVDVEKPEELWPHDSFCILK